MLQEQRNLILDNFSALIKKCDLKTLLERLCENGVETTELTKYPNFALNDDNHKKRTIFFNLMNMEHTAYAKLIKSLKEIGQYELADRLNGKKSSCVPFRGPVYTSELPEINNLSVEERVADCRPVEINVRVAVEFRDTHQFNNTKFYKTRSKNRGIALIINNYDFSDLKSRRNGAEIDQINIKKLFGGVMGFDVITHTNVTAENMKQIIRDFATVNKKSYDICYVIVMTHGGLANGETVMFGIDEDPVETSWIISQFSNKNSPLFEGKPKIFCFQTCRGEKLDKIYEAGAECRTEHDSITFNKPTRAYSDMLIVYPTIIGFKAHRDTEKGSWFIDAMCEIFMEHAHEMHIESMMKKIDERFSVRMSEKRSMQTLNFENWGFKNCYFHPGIYEENGDMLQFDR